MSWIGVCEGEGCGRRMQLGKKALDGMGGWKHPEGGIVQYYD